MPMTLNVGLSKKMGLPAYGSLGATCQVAVELESGLLQTDLEAFHRHVRSAFSACRAAVTEELARQGRETTSSPATGSTANASDTGRAREPIRKATWGQRRAIEAIAQRHQLELAELLQPRFGTRELADLSITQASALIDELNTLVHGGAVGSRNETLI